MKNKTVSNDSLKGKIEEYYFIGGPYISTHE